MRTAFIALSSLLLLGAPQAWTQQSADERELAAYRLTMETVRKVDAAMGALAAEAQKDPRFQERAKLEAEIEALENKEARTEAEEARLEQLREKLDAGESEEPALWDNAETLSEMAAAVANEPMFSRALRSAGLSPREYAKFTLSYLQAAAGLIAKRGGAEVPKEIPVENVRFLEEHEAELTALQKKWEALGKES